MSNEVVTFVGMANSIAADDRLNSPERKCEVFAELTRDGDPAWPDSDYAGRLNGACADFPL